MKALKISENLAVAQMYVGMGWVQHVLARSATGIIVKPTSWDAASWCAAGALNVMPEWPIEPQYLGADYLDQACRMLGWERPFGEASADFVLYNDAIGRTQDEVLDMFSIAIDLAEAAGE